MLNMDGKKYGGKKQETDGISHHIHDRFGSNTRHDKRGMVWTIK